MLLIIIAQLYLYLSRNTSYPCSGIPIKYWDWECKNGNVVYNQLKTLLNYINKSNI